MPADRAGRLIALARVAIAFERALPRLLPALGLAGLFLVAALLGLFAFLPWPVHALILAALVTGIGLLLYRGFSDFILPDWLCGARRLERDSALLHRPISESGDLLAAGEGDALAQALWRLHLSRRTIAHLRLSLPRADLQARDPKRLRYGLAALLLAALVFAGHAWQRNLIGGFAPGLLSHATLDAWIDPPAYTGLAPIYLDARETKVVSIPAGSILNLRVHGANRTPGAALGAGNPPASFQGRDGEYAGAARLAADSPLRIRAGGRTIGRWMLHVIADVPPSIAFSEAPSRTEHDAVKFSFTAKDDYGV
ncbi:MAG TPA: DUF4175 family protein, partial [Rhizomicrobium sp.]